MSKERTGCQARVVGDEYHCGRCGLQWDINDGDPPVCDPGRPVKPHRSSGARLDPLRDGPPISMLPRDDDPLAEARAILGGDDDES